MSTSEIYTNNQPVLNGVDHTLKEILSQSSAWQDALEVVNAQKASLKKMWQENQFSEVLVTGCGSTYYLSQAVAPLIQKQLGVRARALPASELLLFPETVVAPNSNPLLLTISRSGSTTETVRATQLYKARQKGAVLNIGCYPDAPLVAESDLSLTMPNGQEQSVVQTRSFSAMLLAAQAAVAALVDEQLLQAMQGLPEQGKALTSSYHELAKRLGEDPNLQRFYFLGSGLQYGLASEANLKMKEMSLSVAEAFHFMEFRHGPMSMVNEHTLVVGILSDEAAEYEMAVLREMRAIGGKTLVFTEKPVSKEVADYQVVFNSDLPETGRAVLNLPVLQLLGYYRAKANGQTPDTPHNLTAVITLDA